jgi:hypothetical protein
VGGRARPGGRARRRARRRGELPLAPQLADHVLYGTIVGATLASRD